jgi:hypothetical protein
LLCKLPEDQTNLASFPYTPLPEVHELLEERIVMIGRSNIAVENVQTICLSYPHPVGKSDLMCLISTMNDFSLVHLTNIGLELDGTTTDTAYTF